MRVTTKGQVTIPRDVREAMGISPETEVDFVEENGRYYIVKSSVPAAKRRFRALRGIATANMSTEEILNLTRNEE